MGRPSKKKRVAIFKRHKRKGKAIHFFQETHSTVETESEFRSQFETANLYFSHGTSNSNGVIIAISKEYEIEIIQVIKDDEGRYLIIHIRYDNEEYILGNMYAPTRNFELNQIHQCKLILKQLHLRGLEITEGTKALPLSIGALSKFHVVKARKL